MGSGAYLVRDGGGRFSRSSGSRGRYSDATNPSYPDAREDRENTKVPWPSGPGRVKGRRDPPISGPLPNPGPRAPHSIFSASEDPSVSGNSPGVERVASVSSDAARMNSAAVFLCKTDILKQRDVWQCHMAARLVGDGWFMRTRVGLLAILVFPAFVNPVLNVARGRLAPAAIRPLATRCRPGKRAAVERQCAGLRPLLPRVASSIAASWPAGGNISVVRARQDIVGLAVPNF